MLSVTSRPAVRAAKLWIAAATMALVLGGCASSSRVGESGSFRQSGVASYYGRQYHGRTTASGERFDMHAMTAAHRTLPFGTHVRITSRDNGRSVIVRINDRGPFVAGRIIDLSQAAAQELGMLHAGLADVELRVVDSGAFARAQ